MPRAKSSDFKPKGRMSAYAFFVQRCREEHKKSHPDESVVFSEFSRKCAERWKTMDNSSKQAFFDLAECDKDRYESDMVSMGGGRGGRGSRKRRQRKDPNAPKRALSAFFWFCGEERAKVRAAGSNMSVGDVAKELGKRWATVVGGDKEKWEELARKDKARYQKEMEAYKGGTFMGGQSAAAPPQNGDNDSEDDMDDDDDDQ